MPLVNLVKICALVVFIILPGAYSSSLVVWETFCIEFVLHLVYWNQVWCRLTRYSFQIDTWWDGLFLLDLRSRDELSTCCRYRWWLEIIFINWPSVRRLRHRRWLVYSLSSSVILDKLLAIWNVFLTGAAQRFWNAFIVDCIPLFRSSFGVGCCLGMNLQIESFSRIKSLLLWTLFDTSLSLSSLQSVVTIHCFHIHTRESFCLALLDIIFVELQGLRLKNSMVSLSFSKLDCFIHFLWSCLSMGFLSLNLLVTFETAFSCIIF